MDKLREEFEVWAKSYDPAPNLDRENAGMNYIDSSVDIAWIAWRASRASIVVELPPAMEIANIGKRGDIWADVTRYRNACADALRAAGITVKGDSDA